MRRLVLAAVGSAALALPAAAQHEGHVPAAPPPACALPRPMDCALQVTPAFAPDGALWLAWVRDSHVWAARSPNGGAGFEAPLRVSGQPAAFDENGENRPKLAIAADGRLFAAWTVKGAKPYTGVVWFARGRAGQGFEPAIRISDADASSRFESLVLAPSGRLYAAWIDKRRAGKDYAGASVAVAWSDDGAAFAPTVVAQDHSCECCRTAMALDDNGLPLVMWRHVFPPNIRDHAVMGFTAPDQPGPLRRVSDDDWAIDACPHHGPALAAAAGLRHAVWFTQGKRRKGLFYARAEGDGAFSEPMALGDPANMPAHGQVAAIGRRVVVAWKEFDGRQAMVRVIASADGGATWSAPATVLTTAGGSDHPVLIADGSRIHLSWLTRGEGWRWLTLEGLR